MLRVLLALSNTSCHYPVKEPWNNRIKFVSEKGLAAIVSANMERWFTKDFRDRVPAANHAFKLAGEIVAEVK